MGRDGVQTEAVVLSGGGAKGAYEVGVLQALIEGKSPATGFRPLVPEIYTGTSVGAYNASFLAAKGELPPVAVISELAELWRQRIADTPQSCGNGVYRLRGAPLQLGDPGCLLHPVEELSELTRDAAYFANYLFTRGTQFLLSPGPIPARLADSFDFAAFFSPEPFYELVRDTIDPQGLRGSTALTIIASNWKLGAVRYFSGPEIADRIGPAAIVASASIPGIFPPVPIDGVPYVDGGVVMNTPLKPAIRDGADVLHVVYLDPCVLEIPFPRYPNTLDTFYRLYATLQAQAFRRDIATVAAVNLVAAAGGPHRLLTVHNYRPQDDLGGALGMLDFRQEAVNSMIAQGYQDAVSHDCARSLCVMPSLAAGRLRKTA